MDRPKSYLLTGDNLEAFKHLRDLELELVDRIQVIQQKYQDELDAVTRTIADEAAPIRKKIQTDLGVPEAEQEFWYFDHNYYDAHGVVVLYFNEEARNRKVMAQAKGQTKH